MSTPVRILFIEDSPDEVTLVSEALEQGGFTVDGHRVQTEAGMRAALAEQRFDAVLSDFELAELSCERGLEVYRDLDLDLPFIVVSGTAGESMAVEAMRWGAHDYLRKDRLTRLAAALTRELREAELRRQRRRALAALAESEARVRRLVDNAVDLVFRYQVLPQPRFAFVSPAAQGMLGLGPEAHYANAELWFELCHRDDAGALERLLYEGGVDAANPRLRFHHPDGKLLTLEPRATAIRDADGKVVAVEGIVRDVSPQVALERQLETAQRMEAIGRFAGGIAHDFNNILTAILTTTSLLEDAGLDEHLRLEVQVIREAGQRAADLTRQLLAFSRGRALESYVLDLSEVVASVRDMLERVIGEDVLLGFALSEEPCWIEGDRAQVEQVLMNLVVNARDAMPSGGELVVETNRVELTDSEVPTLAAGSYATLRVADTGAGMDPATVERVFEPFFTTKPAATGTGLGLSTVYGIVTQGGGSIEVDSAAGKGTAFTVYFPTQRAPRPEPEPAPEPTPGGRGERLLLVEDDDKVRRVTARLLVKEGYEVRQATDARAAFEIIDAHAEDIDIVLTDRVMPGMDGLELAHRIRAAQPGIALVLMSGYASDHVKPPAGVEIIGKPFTSAELLAALRRALEAG